MAWTRALPNFLVTLLVGCGAGANPAAPAPEVQSKPRTASVPARPAPKPRPLIGMNLGGIADWSSEWPFADAFKTSRPWMEQGKGPFTYDDRGDPLLRPGQAVETLLFRGLGGKYPEGKYVATYAGSGEVDISRFDIDAVMLKKPGRIEFRVKPGDEGVLVKVTASAPRDPVRDLRVFMPGCESTPTPFHPLYLERLRPFRAVRFMDWQRTNRSPLAVWSQRAKLDDLRYSTDAGVPVELMIDLANRLKADPWFCVPHRADDDFVRSLARLIRDRLDPALRVYVEYSNEVWNWGFEQTGYALEQGRKLQLGAPEHLRYYSRRSVEVFRIFEAEFGGKERLVRVLAGQFVNPGDCEHILTFEDAHKQADALAVGAYFGYDLGSSANAEGSARMSVDEIFDKCRAEIDGPFRDSLRRQSFLARKYGLQLLAYEGGQHLVGHGGAENNEALTDLLIRCNRDERMADLYRRLLKQWTDEGGGAFMAFSYAGLPSKWGSWGALEYQDQPIEKAPKYRTLAETALRLTR